MLIFHTKTGDSFVAGSIEVISIAETSLGCCCSLSLKCCLKLMTLSFLTFFAAWWYIWYIIWYVWYIYTLYHVPHNNTSLLICERHCGQETSSKRKSIQWQVGRAPKYVWIYMNIYEVFKIRAPEDKKYLNSYF